MGVDVQTIEGEESFLQAVEGLHEEGVVLLVFEVDELLMQEVGVT